MRRAHGGVVVRRSQTDSQWRAQRLAAVPRPWRYKVERKHAAMLRDADKLPAGRGLVTQAIQQANGWLLQTTAGLADLRLPVTLTDAELCEAAARLAKEAFSLAELVPGVWTGIEELRARMGRFCQRYGIEPPRPTVTDQGAIARMTDGLWWRRKLRASQARELEKNAVALGFVHRKAEVYASNVTVERRAQQKQRNARNLEAIEAVNTVTGDVFTLSELAARAVSNPVIRRGELMTRIAGFDAVAVGMGHAREMWTGTTPSRMHPKRTARDGGVFENKKFDGTTPRQAQQYMVKVFARFRAAVARRGLDIYGFRIAEPHHDATPHWHILFFMPVRAVRMLQQLFSDYFHGIVKPWWKFHKKMGWCVQPGTGVCWLECDGGEKGADEYRVDFERIKDGKSAAGYVTKYVSKNIDGFKVQLDFESGMDAVISSRRVEAWASTWGIRQFQQVGGPPVGVWRELRRVAKDASSTPAIEDALSAVNAKSWQRYVQVQGGPVVARNDLPLRVAYTQPGQRYNAQDGRVYPANLTRYGEQAQAAVYGVMDVRAGVDVVSRVFQWELKGGKNAGEFRKEGKGYSVNAEALQVERAVVQVARAGALGFDVGPSFSAPWSPVNNCTRMPAETEPEWLSGRDLALWKGKYPDQARWFFDDGGGKNAIGADRAGND